MATVKLPERKNTKSRYMCKFSCNYWGMLLSVLASREGLWGEQPQLLTAAQSRGMPWDSVGCCGMPPPALLLAPGPRPRGRCGCRGVWQRRELTAARCERGGVGQAEHSCESGQCPFYRVKSYPCEINGKFAITGPGFLPEVPHCNLR